MNLPPAPSQTLPGPFPEAFHAPFRGMRVIARTDVQLIFRRAPPAARPAPPAALHSPGGRPDTGSDHTAGALRGGSGEDAVKGVGTLSLADRPPTR
ncbi:hypothetical protein GCM10010420_07560 [Streptomyces glaucosporus]|uniref:Uncharacterized protein n=1 Tax=Streptomyces glaucosporus TaxID=284044 RepID=A0ABN3HTH6_9ACTN